MNRSWAYLVKSSYRRQPVFACIVTIALVDIVLGGLDSSTSLLAFGLGLGVGALVFRWWFGQRQMVAPEPEVVPQRYLPPQSSSSPLPPLETSQRPSRRSSPRRP